MSTATERRAYFLIVLAAIAGLKATSPTAVAQGNAENAAQRRTRSEADRRHDLSREKLLYCISYAHLDTQWRWDFPITIDRYIRDTLEQNFERFEKYPEYTFNFTGSVRYEMMKEYYPGKYARLKDYIAAGRWFVSGSSVDEGDVNVPSPESIIRQVLYGNLFFRREFGKESTDFMLPDCFGFPASMPSIWAHCGLLGFSTQKLTWGSAVGIPFEIGVWEGPDGHSVLAALKPGAYVGAITGRADRDDEWARRIETNGKRYGVFADYHYWGVGDRGGAPREEDVKNYTASMKLPGGKYDLTLAPSDQLYKDITPQQRSRLPRYRGDMLLTEHSAGTLTSQAYMKRWNRKCEQLADAAERAAVAAWCSGGAEYPRDKLERAWVRFLANQMHDILPGTSIPEAYDWSWNDEIVAMNLFAEILRDSVGAWSRLLDTRTEGAALLVYNPLAIDREDLVEADVALPAAASVRVYGPDGSEVPSQVLSRTQDSVRVLFVADVPAISLTVFDVRSSESGWTEVEPALHISKRQIENENYRVAIDDRGDVAAIFDKRLERELLHEPHRLVFTHESPQQYPAWNMDWEDRQQPPIGHVDGTPKVRIVEQGPLRVGLEITREARGSIFTQTIRLPRGTCGESVLFNTEIDWQTTGGTVKATFPLSAANEKATYNWGLGTIERRNNDPKKYEVPSHEWFDLSDRSGRFGVTILEDCKYGSDKPSDNEVRLTLLYSPETPNVFQDQHSQDWGKHTLSYAIHGHEGDWRSGRSEWHGRRLNQPLRAFTAPKHTGTKGRQAWLLSIDSPQVDIRAVKLAEERDEVVIRLQELWGQDGAVRVRFASGIASGEEVDGQERRIGVANVGSGELAVSMKPFEPRAFAIRLNPQTQELNPPTSTPIDLPFNTDVASTDRNPADGTIDSAGRSIPAEMLPQTIVSEGIRFHLGSTKDGTLNAVACDGQTVSLPDQSADRVYLLACASSEDDVDASFRFDTLKQTVSIQPWTGFIGQWDKRVWNSTMPEEFFSWNGRVVGIEPAYIRRDPIAWFATHRHHPERGNEPYHFSYLFKYALSRPKDVNTMKLPKDRRIKILSASLAEHSSDDVAPAAPLYDHFSADRHIAFRHTYDKGSSPVIAGLEPAGRVAMDRASRFDGLVMGPPSSRDIADSSSGYDIMFHAVSPNERFKPHVQSGLDDGRLPRLNDGEAAENNDDISRCVWYEQQGRFYADLRASMKIKRINTYSRHVSNRAPQYFSLWGASSTTLPDAEFGPGESGEWEFISLVDTRDLGLGGTHGSTVLGINDDLGPYRYLLWIAEDVGQGTFFTEIDIYAH